MGCIWLISAFRRTEQTKHQLIQSAPGDMLNYQEYVQFLAGMALNQEEIIEWPSQIAPPSVKREYDGRMCDLAYRVLCSHLEECQKHLRPPVRLDGGSF